MYNLMWINDISKRYKSVTEPLVYETNYVFCLF
jgi:hypothetical protein